MLHGLLQVWFGWVRDGGYLGIIALMAMESSIFPVPSEIVIPAGIARMSFGVFSLVTVLGAFIWCTVLTWFGARITAAHPDLMNDPEALMRMVKQEGHWIVGAVLVLCALYVLVMWLTSRNSK